MTIRIDYGQTLIFEVLRAFMLATFPNDLTDWIEIDDRVPSEGFPVRIAHHGYGVDDSRGETLIESVNVWVKAVDFGPVIERDERDLRLIFVDEFAVTWKNVEVSIYRSPEGTLLLGRWNLIAA